MKIEITTLNVYFQTQGDELMSAVTQINEAIASLKTSQSAALGRIETDVAELKRLATSGEVITPEQLTGILTSLGEVKTAIDGIDPLPEFPAPAPTPVEG